MAIEEPKYAVSLHEGACEFRDYSLISPGATTICADLCGRYGIEATRNNPGVANENSRDRGRQRPYQDPPTGNAPWTLRNYTRTCSALGLKMSAVARPLDWVSALSLADPSCASHPIYRANRPGSGHPHSLYSATITPIMEATCGDESFLR